ncbi:hypothetical protein [Streptomyces griseorubiginosus]|uniref:hypothetical protein n=1 Tax=Streptomyces griseorubiginosus TaxID=67304 RepID=UPI0036E2CCB9
MFLARTVYVLACDGCGDVCHLPDLHDDTESDYELQLSEPQLEPDLARHIEAQG